MVVAALVLLAVDRQFALQRALGLGTVNFFSYFTILANLFAAIVLIASARHLAARRPASSVSDVIRGASVVSMAIVGIVFTLLLSNEDLGPLLPWVNAVTHYVMPVAVVLDWLADPPQSRITFRQALLWLIFPFAYLFYVLVRGAAVTWYPYPFLDPAKVGGYGGVAMYCGGIAVTFLVVGALLMWATSAARRGR